MEYFRERLAQLQGDMKDIAFAKKCGLPNATIGMYRNGSIPSLEKAAKIAKACDVSLDWLAHGLEEDAEDFRSAEVSSIHAALWSVLDTLNAVGSVKIDDELDRASVTNALIAALSHQGSEPAYEFSELVSPATEFRRALEHSAMDLQTVSEAANISVAAAENLLGDDSAWTPDLALKIAKALEISPLPFLQISENDGWADVFFSLWSQLTDAEKSDARSVLQSMLRSQGHQKQ